MSLKPIRQYFVDRIYSLDTEYQEHTDAFNTENIGGLTLDKAYHIFYGSVQTSALNHLTTKDVVSTTLSIFTRGYQNPNEALDDAMDFANHLRLECMKPKFANTGQFIKNVVCNSIEASPVNEQNDNSIIIKLQFSITVIFGIGINLNCDC